MRSDSGIFKFIVSFFLFAGTLPLGAIGQKLSIEQVRAGFPTAVAEEKACIDLHSRMKNFPDTDNMVWNAYYATLTITLAKYTMSPLRKYRYFNEGKSMLEYSVMKDPESVEIRFLRMRVQEYSPAFLGYNKDFDSDKKFILGKLDKIPQPGLKKSIIHYISISNRFSDSEKSSVLKTGS